MKLGWMLPLLLAVGCTTDLDGDGYSDKDDCDDNDATASPSFSEICDGVDNDCDGDVDENVTDVYYLDADGDGYGFASLTTRACDVPSGYVENQDDCDDSNSNSYPGADELCDGQDNDCDDNVDEGATTVYYADHDQDGFGSDLYTSDNCEIPSGYAVIGGDCDDTDADVNPNAEEICDGIDNDCSGDEDGDDDRAVDAITWYYDEDGDGFGIASKTTDACEQPGNHAAVIGDCNDLDAAIHPDAIELCDADGVDEDCDGYANDDDVDIFGQDVASVDEASGAIAWYGDADGDGYGGMDFSLVACEQPDNHIDNADDCDDLNAAIHPMATEICDEADNDCDTLIDDDDNSLDVVDSSGTAVVWYIDVDQDGYGSEQYTLRQCVQPSGYVALDIGLDCDDQDDEVSPGLEEVCNDGKDNNCDDSLSPCALEGDIDAGDAAFVIRGDEESSDSGDDGSDSGDDGSDSGDDGSDSGDAGDMVGAALAIGDLNKDGYDDLVVGASGVNGADTDSGAVYVFYGPFDDDGPFDDTSQQAASDSHAVFQGDVAYDDAGYAVAAVDLDGDNYDDVVISSIGEGLDSASSSAEDVGAVYVFYGSATEWSGTLSLSDDSDAVFAGFLGGEQFGCSVANAGDTNGDNREELLVGSCSENTVGAATLIYGTEDRFDGSIVVADEIDAIDDDTTGSLGGYATWQGETNGSYTGQSVAGISDFNGDGLADFAFGAPNHDVAITPTTTATDAGAAFVIYGDATEDVGSLDTESASAVFYGENEYDYAGYAVSGLGDVNGDGYADLAIGAPNYNRDSTCESCGIAYVIFGAASVLGEMETDTHILGETRSDLLGKGIGHIGDINDDGYADVAVGAPGEDDNYGATYLIYGPLTGEIEASDDSDAKFLGNSNGAGNFGLTFGGLGDLDADGDLDLVVGARDDDDDGERDNTDLGAVYVFLGGGL